MQPSDSLPNIENAILSISGALGNQMANTMTHPYKFRARRTTAMNTSAGAFAKITFDTEDYDINSNYASGTYTVPVSGYYLVTARASFGNNPGQALLAIYKNGSIYQRGNHLINTSGVQGPLISDIVYFSQNDTVEIYVFADNAVAFETTAGSQAYFGMHLLSRDGVLSLGSVTNPAAVAYKFNVYLAADQSIGIGATTKITFNTEEFDTGSNFDSTTNYRFTVPVSGFYHFDLCGRVGNGVGATGTSLLLLYKNGAEIRRGDATKGTGDNLSDSKSTINCTLQLVAGDYLEAYWYNGDPGSARSVTGGSNKTWWTGFYLSA